MGLIYLRSKMGYEERVSDRTVFGEKSEKTVVLVSVKDPSGRDVETPLAFLKEKEARTYGDALLKNSILNDLKRSGVKASPSFLASFDVSPSRNGRNGPYRRRAPRRRAFGENR